MGWSVCHLLLEWHLLFFFQKLSICLMSIPNLLEIFMKIHDLNFTLWKSHLQKSVFKFKHQKLENEMFFKKNYPDPQKQQQLHQQRRLQPDSVPSGSGSWWLERRKRGNLVSSNVIARSVSWQSTWPRSESITEQLKSTSTRNRPKMTSQSEFFLEVKNSYWWEQD